MEADDYDGYGDTEPHSYRHGYTHRDGGGYAFGYRYSHSCTLADTFNDPDSHSHSDGYASGYRHSHSCTFADANANACY